MPAVASAFALRLLSPRLLPGERPGASVAWGPDGSMWFTTSEGRIARLAPSGKVSEFGHGLTNGGAFGGLVVGGDGGLWFRELGVGTGEISIARISTRGVISEYPSGMSQIDAIVRGSDGAVWYAGCTVSGPCLYNEQIGRMDPSGRRQMYTNPLGPIRSLVLADDRQLWFPLGPEPVVGPPQIGRISPGGRISTLPLPAGTAITQPLVPGPDGGVWFSGAVSTSSRSTTMRLGYITDAGRVEMLAPLSHGVIDATPLAPGPHGGLWYHEFRSGDPPFNPTWPGSWSVLKLITQSGKLTAADAFASLTPDIATPRVRGPDGSLWSASPLSEIVNANATRPTCLVPDVTGSLLGSPDVTASLLGSPAIGDVFTEAAWLQLWQVGCAYHASESQPATRAAHPLVVVRQQPRSDTVIPTGQPIRLTVKQAPSRYGRCHAPVGTVQFVHTRTAVLLTRPLSASTQPQEWGCLTRVGRVRSLFTGFVGEDTSTASDYRVSGRYVAFSTNVYSHEYDQETCAIVVVNLQTDSKLNLPTPCVDDLAVSRTGVVAWQYHSWIGPGPSSGPPFAQVIAHDTTGTHVLDTAEPLDLGTLTFSGDVLHWSNDGHPRQAQPH
jgi:virginiamycin B lyase